MISVVVPCYNEEGNIERLVERFVALRDRLANEGFELILVNNGSADNTSLAIDNAVSKYDFIVKVNIEKNNGYGYGIIEGLKVCRGDWLGWIHADLQLPPEAFIDFYDIIQQDVDKATNSYFKGRRSNRSLSDRFFTTCMGIYESMYLGKRLWDINAQPTLIHRQFYVKIDNPPFDFSLDLYVYYLARKFGMNVIRVPVIQQERKEGKSSWNDGKFRARVNFIKRTLAFSKTLKKRIKEEKRH